MSAVVYRFFDSAGDLLYIGISLRPWERWMQHRSDKPWWTEVASITLEAHADRASAAAAELSAIRAERPRYNLAGHPDVHPPKRRTLHGGAVMGTAEIAEYLGVSRQRVAQLYERPDFPAPGVTLAMGHIWRTEDILDWAERTGRLSA